MIDVGPLRRGLILMTTLCLSSIVCYAALASGKERGIVFGWKLENKAFGKFFGDYRGSYLVQNQLMTTQFLDLFELDYTATGHTISEMPALGDGTYLDVGQEWHSEYPNDMGALILSPSGEIMAAAIFWQRSNVPSGYRTGPVFLTIFVKNRSDQEETKKSIKILENFGQLAYQNYLGRTIFLQGVLSSNQWRVRSVKDDLPTNIVYLNGN